MALFLYEYGNGSEVIFNHKGMPVDKSTWIYTDVVGAKIVDVRTILVETRQGLRKTFRLTDSQYRLKKVVDSFNNSLVFDYAGKKLTEISSSAQTKLRIDYDELGRLTTIVGSDGRSVSYHYNESGYLRAVDDIHQQRWTYDYTFGGQLSRATTPNGVVDISLNYHADGRAQSVTRNGISETFAYFGQTTTATDGRGKKTSFEQSAFGNTVGVTNSLGITTSVSIDKHGIPLDIRRNGKIVARAEFSEHRQRYPSRVIQVNANGERTALLFDDNGRVSGARSNGDTSFEVASYVSGAIPKTVKFGNGERIEIGLDRQGNLSRFTNRSGQSWRLKRSRNELTVRGPTGTVAKLGLNERGQVKQVDPPVGKSVRYEYDGAGLRQSAVVDSGARIEYYYDSSGSLFSTAVATNQIEMMQYAYISGANNRLDRIESDNGIEAQFEYNAVGLPMSATSRFFVDLAFGYDSLGRLNLIIPEGKPPLTYDYAPGEADIAQQLDTMTGLPATQHHEITDFGLRLDAFYARAVVSNYGYFRYDDSSREISLHLDPSSWNPASQIEHVFANLKLAELFRDSGPNFSQFSKPSNRLFIPAEYWGINCCYCCEGGPDTCIS